MMEINEYDIVKMPFDEIGLVRHVDTKKLWGNMVHMEVIHTRGIFHKLGEEVEYKPESLKVVKKLEF